MSATEFNPPRIHDDEPIQPVFQQYMEDLDVWKSQWDFHRSAQGELVLIGSGGPDGTAIASDDEGRTWRSWPQIQTWPEGSIEAVARRGEELFVGGEDTRIWHSQDEGKTWSGGQQLLKWPKHIQVGDARALLWTPTGDRILVTQENHLLVSVDFLLGGEGSGPELVGALFSEDSGQTWRLYELFGPPPGYRDRPEGFGEPKLVELADGRIWMVFRTCLGHLWQAFSKDGGRTWGEPTSTGLVSPLAPLNAQRVSDTDAVIVVWSCARPTESTVWRSEHNFWFPRGPMVFAVSHNHCKTWSRPVVVTRSLGYMRNICFSAAEMFINYEEGTSLDHWVPGFRYLPKLVIYDLKDVLERPFDP